jgi:hypothetical protein
MHNHCVSWFQYKSREKNIVKQTTENENHMKLVTKMGLRVVNFAM